MTSADTEWTENTTMTMGDAPCPPWCIEDDVDDTDEELVGIRFVAHTSASLVTGVMVAGELGEEPREVRIQLSMDDKVDIGLSTVIRKEPELRVLLPAADAGGGRSAQTLAVLPDAEHVRAYAAALLIAADAMEVPGAS